MDPVDHRERSELKENLVTKARWDVVVNADQEDPPESQAYQVLKETRDPKVVPVNQAQQEIKELRDVQAPLVPQETKDPVELSDQWDVMAQKADKVSPGHAENEEAPDL